MNDRILDHSALLRLAEARATLERLWSLTDGEDPYEPVPARWVAAWHQAVSAIATNDAQESDSLDGISMRMLHQRALEALHDTDHLVAGLATWPIPPQSPIAATRRSTP